jgi:probable F420-dependent oxidoreductase
MLGQVYGPPLATMRNYLDAMDATTGGTPVDASTAPTVLAALGPKMLALAGERAGGAHSFLAPVAHTASARDLLGPDPLLAPAIKAVLTDDRAAGTAIARGSVQPTSGLPAYRGNLLRSGFTEDDLSGGLSDRLVDALVAVGDVDAIVARVREHLDAGADHVCVEVLTGDDTTVPLDAWRRLAPALTELG